MQWKLYDRLTEDELVGRKVKTLEPMANGKMEIPAGTVCTITRKWGGFNLKAEPCESCGVSVYITRVSPEQVEFLPEKPPQEQLEFQSN